METILTLTLTLLLIWVIAPLKDREAKNVIWITIYRKSWYGLIEKRLKIAWERGIIYQFEKYGNVVEGRLV